MHSPVKFIAVILVPSAQFVFTITETIIVKEIEFPVVSSSIVCFIGD